MEPNDDEVVETKRRLGINAKQLGMICFHLAKTLAPDTQGMPEDGCTWLRTFVHLDHETQEGLVQDHKNRMRVIRAKNAKLYGSRRWGR